MDEGKEEVEEQERPQDRAWITKQEKSRRSIRVNQKNCLQITLDLPGLKLKLLLLIVTLKLYMKKQSKELL